VSDPELRHWTVRSSRFRVDDPFLRVRSDTVELPDGTIIKNYFVRESRGFVIVAAVTKDRRVVLVRQYKHGIGRITLELPAGMIDPGEEPADCAVRELAEETGYAGDPPQLLRTLAADPTSSNALFHVFLIENAVLSFAQSLDTTEAIVVETIPVEDLRVAVRDGRIDAGSQLAAAYIALDHMH
jgi:8-oxo-dGTP pyrophosphatase MutT (NUDIX family)